MIRVAILTASLLALMTVGAWAQSIEDARAKFDAGDFVAAADVAEAVGTSESYSLAAESLAIYGYYVAADDEKQAIFVRAVDLADEAIAADDQNPEAHLQASHAMGRYAQTIGVMEALSDGYADKVRGEIDAALALNPDFMEAHISLAAWHAEITASAGFMAKMLYGATEEDALKHYQIAMDLAPDQKGVGLEYAIGLMRLDKNEYGDQVRGLLEADIAMAPTNAYAELLHQRAIEKLAELDAD